MSQGELPLHIKFLIEGEEEIGSPNLSAFLKEHQDLLKATATLNPDSGMIAAETPTITYGLRGLAYFELRVYGPEHDLHSGLFGGVVDNPAQVLCELIASIHDEKGPHHPARFLRPGNPTGSRRAPPACPASPQRWKSATRTNRRAELWGEEGFTPLKTG